VKASRELPDGYEFQFPSDSPTVMLIVEWAAGEHLCCPFFDIDLRQERGKGAFWLRLTGRSGVKAFIEADFSTWMGPRAPSGREQSRTRSWRNGPR